MLTWAHQQVIADLIPHLLEQWKLQVHSCKDLGIVISWEKLDLKLKRQFQYLGMPIVTVQEKIFSSDSRIIRFQEVR